MWEDTRKHRHTWDTAVIRYGNIQVDEAAIVQAYKERTKILFLSIIVFHYINICAVISKHEHIQE